MNFRKKNQELDEFVLQFLMRICNESMVQFKSNLYNDAGDLSSIESFASIVDAFLKYTHSLVG